VSLFVCFLSVPVWLNGFFLWQTNQNTNDKR
jgi:hypothetical protein